MPLRADATGQGDRRLRLASTDFEANKIKYPLTNAPVRIKILLKALRLKSIAPIRRAREDHERQQRQVHQPQTEDQRASSGDQGLLEDASQGQVSQFEGDIVFQRQRVRYEYHRHGRVGAHLRDADPDDLQLQRHTRRVDMSYLHKNKVESLFSNSCSIFIKNAS